MKFNDFVIFLVVIALCLVIMVTALEVETKKELVGISDQLTELIEISNQRYEELCSRIEVLEEAIK